MKTRAKDQLAIDDLKLFDDFVDETDDDFREK
jgi:hypothetical protein